MYNGRDGVVTDDNGLIYMRARYYSPELRRFVNADIIAGEITSAIKIKGRNDDLIIKSGMNIYPVEIEGVIKQDPRVKEVLVYGFHNSFGTQIGMKLVGDFSSTEEVKQLCMKALPSFQVPSVIELVDELPKNGSGKIIRRNPV